MTRRGLPIVDLQLQPAAEVVMQRPMLSMMRVCRCRLCAHAGFQATDRWQNTGRLGNNCWQLHSPEMQQEAPEAAMAASSAPRGRGMQCHLSMALHRKPAQACLIPTWTCTRFARSCTLLCSQLALY